MRSSISVPPRPAIRPAPRAFAITQPLTPTFVDYWRTYHDTNFESADFLGDNCFIYDQNTNDPFDRKWGTSSDRFASPFFSLWPATGGINAVTNTTSYPPELDTWFLCGPFDTRNQDKFMIRFNLWAQILDSGDEFFVGITTDQAITLTTYFAGALITTTNSLWENRTIFFPDAVNMPYVWVVFKFFSDSGGPAAPGPWIDDFQIWYHTQPAIDCANQDRGYKGLGFEPYDGNIPGVPPIINVNDTKSLTHVVESDARWVRLPFLHKGGKIEYQDYDRIIDSLCASGVSVLGLVHYDTLLRKDYNDPNTAAAYRAEFSARAADLAAYFNGRIKYWEVWNEPDGDAQVREDRFVPLLNEAYNAIQQANPNSKVMLGGPGSAWRTGGFTYFNNLYEEVKTQLGPARPFDYYSVHPYRDENRYSQAPEIYFYRDITFTSAVGVVITSGSTILNKFIFVVGNDNKPMWITELGWNGNVSAADINRKCTQGVNRFQQAIYLKRSFDILLFLEKENLKLPNGNQAIEKIFWFGYRDFSVPDVTCVENGITVTVTTADWWGLYGAERNTVNQPTQCVFANYPNWGNCIDWYYAYLPLIGRDEEPLTRTK
jgi:hypothetical protein